MMRFGARRLVGSLLVLHVYPLPAIYDIVHAARDMPAEIGGAIRAIVCGSAHSRALDPAMSDGNGLQTAASVSGAVSNGTSAQETSTRA